jgi:hypothetical protein
MSDVDRFLILDIETVPDEHVLTHFPERAQSITVPPPIANRILAISSCLAASKATVMRRVLSPRAADR